jgi:signal transduction histidine kinase
VAVQDHGVGFPAQELPSICAPFYRGSTVARQATGSDIGLFGSRAFVKQEGGTLSLESTANVGTGVTVRLPLGG